MGALFLSLFLLSSVAAEECGTTRIDRYVAIKYVHDGDTVHFADGAKVRLVGINTPELERDRKPAEPYAIEARDGLRKLLRSSDRIAVRYGRERKDRHGRILAHLYLGDGRSVQQWLLEQGYAVATPHPPNLHRVDCYQRAEQAARAMRRGLWRDTAFLQRDATKLRRGDQGFRLLSGVVREIRQGREWVWIAMGEKVSLSVARSDERHFNSLPLESLVGKKVIARGWLTSRKGRWSMRLRHPVSLEIADD